MNRLTRRRSALISAQTPGAGWWKYNRATKTLTLYAESGEGESWETTLDRNEIERLVFDYAGIVNGTYQNMANLTEVRMNEGITQASQDSLFKNCLVLNDWYIPLTFLKGGRYIFNGNTVVCNIHYPGTFAQWNAITWNAYSTWNHGWRLFCNGVEQKSATISRSANYLFSYCLSFESVEFADSVTSISNYMFQYCTNLREVTLGESIVELRCSAFNSCSSLNQLTIMNPGISAVSPDAARRPAAINVISFNGSISQWASIDNLGVFVNSVTNVYINGDELLTGDITIPDTVTHIGAYAFYYQSQVTNVSVPNTVTSIGVSAFAYSGITSFTVPPLISTLSNDMFRDVTFTSDFTIPDNVTTLNSGCLAQIHINNIYMSDSVTTIQSGGQEAFYSANINYIKWSNGLQNQVFGADSWCYAAYIKIHDFRTYTAVPEVSAERYAFISLVNIVVPDSLYNDWIAADGWSSVANKIIKVSEYDALGE